LPQTSNRQELGSNVSFQPSQKQKTCSAVFSADHFTILLSSRTVFSTLVPIVS